MPSLIDTFFRVIRPGLFECKLCGVQVQGAGGRTSNVSKHLRVVHISDYNNAQAASKKAQPPLQAFGVTEGLPYARDGPKQRQLTTQLVHAIADGYLPLAIVDRPSFRKLVGMLDPRYVMPHRRTVTDTVVQQSGAVRASLQKDLQQAETVSITLDLWSNRRMQSFLGETAHYIVEEDGILHLRNTMLACKRFQERHTATNISWQHHELLRDSGIAGKVLVVVTDSAANMKKAFSLQPEDAAAAAPEEEATSDDELGDDVDPDDELQTVNVAELLDDDVAAPPVAAERVSCACHTLQLVVQDGLRSLPPSVSRQIARVNSLVASVKRSTVAAEIMEKRGGVLHTAVVTRWSSQVKCVKSFLAVSPDTIEELATTLPTIAAKVPDQAGRKALEELVEVLTPFADATDALQMEKEPTGSSVLPTLRILRLRLTALQDAAGQLGRMSRTLMASLDRRFCQYEVALFETATILDPRWKLAVLSTSPGERAEIGSRAEEELKAYVRARPLAEASAEVLDDAVTSGACSGPQRPSPAAVQQARDEPPPKRGFFDLLDEVVDQPAPVPERLSMEQRLAAELTEYLAEPREEREPGRALAYWSGQKARKPLLRHWLAIPASSAASERLFSVGGKFYCPSRSRLTPRVFEGLMLLKSRQE